MVNGKVHIKHEQTGKFYDYKTRNQPSWWHILLSRLNMLNKNNIQEIFMVGYNSPSQHVKINSQHPDLANCTAIYAQYIYTVTEKINNLMVYIYILQV